MPVENLPGERIESLVDELEGIIEEARPPFGKGAQQKIIETNPATSPVPGTDRSRRAAETGVILSLPASPRRKRVVLRRLPAAIGPRYGCGTIIR